MSHERWNAAANRLYYACFYSISAYLTKKEIKATAHSGLKAMFNKTLIATGKITKSDGKLFNKLFGIRQEADYEDFYRVGKEDIKSLIPKIKVLIMEIGSIVNTE